MIIHTWGQDGEVDDAGDTSREYVKDRNGVDV